VVSVLLTLISSTLNLFRLLICQHRTRIIPLFDRQSVIDLLVSNKVTFGSKSPSWVRRLATIFLGVFPFLYLALVWKVVNRMYNPR